MTRRLTLLLCAVAASLAALPAMPAAAKPRKAPKITFVSPMRVKLGGTLTIRGRNFSSKRKRNTVIFKAPNGQLVFVKPTRASSRRLVLKVPGTLQRFMSGSITSKSPTRFRMRLSVRRKFGKWSTSRTSPVIVPFGYTSAGGGGGTGGGVATDPACGTGSDYDGDLLSNSVELQIKTDPCLKDTDRDGIEDGYEYQSAKDLNDDESQEPNTSLPYPGQRPYPNPLDAGDVDKDFDGDFLTMRMEQSLWHRAVANGATRTLSPLAYSDGEQYSVFSRGADGRRRPSLAAAGYSKHADFLSWASTNGYRSVMLSDGPPWWAHEVTRNSYGLLDFNRNGVEDSGFRAGYDTSETVYYDADRDGYLSDDERDEDADGLPNYEETRGPATADWFTKCYSFEKPYPIAYTGTDVTDADSDGDGVRDGADDQDHDDVPNLHELSRNMASGLDDRKGGADCKQADGLPSPLHHETAYGRVNPYNPCLPASWSRTCPDYIEFGQEFAPFDESPDWYALN